MQSLSGPSRILPWGRTVEGGSQIPVCIYFGSDSTTSLPTTRTRTFLSNQKGIHLRAVDDLGLENLRVRALMDNIYRAVMMIMYSHLHDN